MGARASAAPDHPRAAAAEPASQPAALAPGGAQRAPQGRAGGAGGAGGAARARDAGRAGRAVRRAGRAPARRGGRAAAPVRDARSRGAGGKGGKGGKGGGGGGGRVAVPRVRGWVHRCCCGRRGVPMWAPRGWGRRDGGFREEEIV